LKFPRLRKNRNKHRYRIVAESVQHFIGDIWAKDEAQAHEIARSLELADLQPICDGTVLIDSVQIFTADDEEFMPFRPIN
jgi:formylmethanofuran dehydrogenase subunit A